MLTKIQSFLAIIDHVRNALTGCLALILSGERWTPCRKARHEIYLAKLQTKTATSDSWSRAWKIDKQNDLSNYLQQCRCLENELAETQQAVCDLRDDLGQTHQRFIEAQKESDRYYRERVAQEIEVEKCDKRIAELVSHLRNRGFDEDGQRITTKDMSVVRKPESAEERRQRWNKDYENAKENLEEIDADDCGGMSTEPGTLGGVMMSAFPGFNPNKESWYDYKERAGLLDD